MGADDSAKTKDEDMEKRVLGRTGIEVSVVGIGGEGFENKPYEACEAIIDRAFEGGINFVDIYNSNPDVRSNVGRALARYPRESFVVEGHIGSAWKNGQYYRTRDMDACRASFADFLERMQLDYVDIGMIHYVDEQADFDAVFNGPLIAYAKKLKDQGVVRSIGLSTHNTDIAIEVAKTGIVDVILFSVNPAYDMLPATDDVNSFFTEEAYDRDFTGIDPKCEEFYRLCETSGVAVTVMKALGAGMLLDGARSPFGRAMTPAQLDPGKLHVLRALCALYERHRHRPGEQVRRSGSSAGNRARYAARPLPVARTQGERVRRMRRMRVQLPVRGGHHRKNACG